MSNLLILYKNIIIKKLIDKFCYKSIMQVPKIIKIILSVSLNYINLEKKRLNDVCENLKLISGQKPIITKCKKSIANFKIRKGYPIGCKVTLRKKNMWNFLDRLIFIAIPSIRDFRGFSIKSFDKYANLNIGIKEQTIFPEIDYEKIAYIHGLNISIITSTKIIKESYFLLKKIYFPFLNH